jgi:hypothetical protein
VNPAGHAKTREAPSWQPNSIFAVHPSGPGSQSTLSLPVVGAKMTVIFEDVAVTVTPLLLTAASWADKVVDVPSNTSMTSAGKVLKLDTEIRAVEPIGPSIDLKENSKTELDRSSVSLISFRLSQSLLTHHLYWTLAV